MSDNRTAQPGQSHDIRQGLCILFITPPSGRQIQDQHVMEAWPGAHQTHTARPNKAAVKKAQRLHPHLILLGGDLTELEGMESARLILNALPAARILALTQHAGRRHAAALLGMGVLGVVQHGCPVPALKKALARVLAGKAFVSPVILKRK